MMDEQVQAAPVEPTVPVGAAPPQGAAWVRRLLGLLSPSGAHARLTVLIFHRVHARPDPMYPGEMDAASFSERMAWVRDWFNVLPLEDAVRALELGNLPARALAITFDDGYADNRTVALPLLQQLGLPATFFVAAGFLDGGRMWNDTVVETLRRCPGPVLDLSSAGLGELPAGSFAQRRESAALVLSSLKYLPPRERARKVEAVESQAGVRLPTDLMMTSRQVRELAASGMTIGAHTLSHPILARLEEREASAEIVEGGRRLADICGQPIGLFAYPNGKPGQDYGPEHVRMARSAGYKAAMSTAWGVAQHGCDTFQLPRFTPWDRSEWRYGLRLAGNLRRTKFATAMGPA